VNEGASSGRGWLAKLGLGARAAVLLGALLLTLAAAAPVGWAMAGSSGVTAAGIAALVCAAPSLAALALTYRLRAPRHALVAMLGGMFLRMGPPLIVALVVHELGGPLVEAGLIYYLAAFYVVALVVETGLSLTLIDRSPRQ
jgi:hypothetical protein